MACGRAPPRNRLHSPSAPVQSGTELCPTRPRPPGSASSSPGARFSSCPPHSREDLLAIKFTQLHVVALASSSLRLDVMQLPIQATFLQEFVVRTAFDQPALLDDEDLVGP